MISSKECCRNKIVLVDDFFFFFLENITWYTFLSFYWVIRSLLSHSQCTVGVQCQNWPQDTVKENTALLWLCPGFIGSLAKHRINLLGFCFFTPLHCIFDLNVKLFVSFNFFSSSVFPWSIYIYCTVYSKLYAAECHRLPPFVRHICKCFHIILTLRL